MDPSNPSLEAEGLDAGHQNGVHEELSNSAKDDSVASILDPVVAEITETVSPNGNVENFN